MKLEDIVCSLDLAKKLRQLGVRKESLYHWNIETGELYDVLYYKELSDKGYLGFTGCAAYTSTEIGEMFPDIVYGKAIQIAKGYSLKKWVVWFTDAQNNLVMGQDDNEANARAEMLIYLIENGLVKAEDLNK